MGYVLVRGGPSAEGLETDLRSTDRLALDCEAAGFHRYSDRLSLLQLTTAKQTYVLDPLTFDPAPLLRRPLEDPEVEVVMHGADYDLRLLARDLDVRVRGLFDTQVAATLLGEPAVGLQALLEGWLDVRLSKKYQRADWAARPLPDEMLEYAADDTRHLLALADRLSERLRDTGRAAWAEEECRLLEDVATDAAPASAAPADPVARVKAARDMTAREVTALREALAWRDGVARARDRAPFRVVGDPVLVEVVLRRPRTVAQLRSIKGFSSALAREEGPELLAHLERVAEMSEDELVPYPRRERRGPGRPPPEVEELANALKRVRNARATELGLDRGALLPNALLGSIAQDAPEDLEQLAAIEGMRRWQVEAVGPSLLSILRSGARS